MNCETGSASSRALSLSIKLDGSGNACCLYICMDLSAPVQICMHHSSCNAMYVNVSVHVQCNVASSGVGKGEVV